ncbi:MAG: cytochrome c biogenesis protein CcdA [Candidatus Eremiobacteraeota bacterium]|nr:cytochrome c biogenesis protein CcdA [Candidatus Eremiobacteraeota bacterium]
MHPQLNALTAFLAGLVSFVSPCVLPLVPSYLSFLTGTTLEDLKTQNAAQERARVLGHAFAFVCGFTVIFVLIGLSASAIGGLFATYKDGIARVGGAIIIILGLNMLGLFKIPLLAMDKRFHLRPGRQSPIVSFLVGIGFAAGWSPCIGPILSAIILLASQERVALATGMLLLYSLGLAIPFLITAAAITQSLNVLNRIKRYLPAIEATSGAILVATGIVLVTGSFTRIAGFFYQYVKPPSL